MIIDLAFIGTSVGFGGIAGFLIGFGIKEANKLLAQIPGQLKDLEKKQSKQIGEIGRQLTQLQSQLKQLQKRVSRIKVGSSSSYTTATLNL
jgi:uncharacterized membrane protein (Fun14 family)